MASARGQLSLLAIVTIFLVVFGTMYAGVQYARGDLIDHEEPTAAEAQLRADVWTAVNAERADRGLDPAQRDTNTRIEAQSMARRLATIDYFTEPTAVGVRPGANESLPNRKGLCQRVPVKLTVDQPDGVPEAGRPLPDEVSRQIADRVVGLLASDPRSDVLSRANDQKHGIGVAVDGDVVYVVYRTCNLGY
ncbi:hypothetical protein [Salinigranum marinum]|uniref:hypothetical protein n=1 Tax=Salinigranum marinum TaxID=1515595 RepID=UPI002989EE80|nr:hypothetical protein [Salinigranum marinum]